jgi:hypothetical protein
MAALLSSAVILRGRDPTRARKIGKSRETGKTSIEPTRVGQLA